MTFFLKILGTARVMAHLILWSHCMCRPAFASTKLQVEESSPYPEVDATMARALFGFVTAFVWAQSPSRSHTSSSRLEHAHYWWVPRKDKQLTLKWARGLKREISPFFYEIESDSGKFFVPESSDIELLAFEKSLGPSSGTIPLVAVDKQKGRYLAIPRETRPFFLEFSPAFYPKKPHQMKNLKLAREANQLNSIFWVEYRMRDQLNLSLTHHPDVIPYRHGALYSSDFLSLSQVIQPLPDHLLSRLKEGDVWVPVKAMLSEPFWNENVLKHSSYGCWKEWVSQEWFPKFSKWLIDAYWTSGVVFNPEIGQLSLTMKPSGEVTNIFSLVLQL